ncbi:hypothetical protein [Longimicrobium sp.]|uniref:hypothetical protein n=1 Tax=Longimicrobium sp. TaxID=2029185 RepID=UPI002E320836|nr:hypothetical protein [Longimicrobium sp.]HEX6040570.1 hypothetical protein [Longimicrobium sp.]
MRTRARRFPWLSCLPLAALLACGDDGTGPADRLELTPGQAAPYTLVDVAGLPEEYATQPRTDITVGGQPSTLVYDPVDKVHRFMVPDLAPGRAEVRIPGTRDGDELQATLEVKARQYAGGSPDAALRQMNTLLDSLQVSVSYGLAIVDTHADSTIYGRMDAFLTLAEGFQDYAATLPAEERARVAAMFSAVAPDLAVLTGQITAGLEELRSQPPIAGSLASATLPMSADAVLSRCLDHQAMLRNVDRISEVMGYVVTVANGLSWLGGPQTRAVVGMFTYAITFATDLAVLVANSVPRLLDPDGLRLEVSPRRMRHNGGEGAMTVWVRRRANGEVLGSAAGIALGLGDVITRMRQYEQLRREVDWDTLREAIEELIQDTAIEEALEWMDDQFSDLLSDHILPSHEVQITMEGLAFTSGVPSSRWEFTGPAGALSRGMRTVGQNQQPVETFTVSARVGATPGCSAVTGAANPSMGLNGFEIGNATRVRFLAPAQGVYVDVAAGSSASATVPVANQGTERSGALTYRLQYANGQPYSPRTWLTVSAPTGPSQLAAGAQGSVRVSITAASNALQQQIVVPVAVLEDGRVVDNAWVQVRVQPQLSDITVNRSPSTLRLWDHSAQDGDIITVTLNGAPVASGLTLTNAGVTVPVEYRRGRNVLIVRAHNEGSSSPNTAALGFANVVRGTATQTYGLLTGGTTQLVITYDPDATSPSMSASALPVPVYTRCEQGAPGECPR